MKNRILWARTEVQNLCFVSQMQLISLHRLLVPMLASIQSRRDVEPYPISEEIILVLANIPLADPVSRLEQLPTDPQQMLTLLARGIDHLLDKWTRSRALRANRDEVKELKRQGGTIKRESSMHVSQGNPLDNAGMSGPSVPQPSIIRRNMPPPSRLPIRNTASRTQSQPRRATAQSWRPQSPSSSLTSFSRTRYTSDQAARSSKATTPSFPLSEVAESQPKGNAGDDPRSGERDERSAANDDFIETRIKEFLANLESSHQDFFSRRGFQ